jgi:hypothetical protein
MELLISIAAFLVSIYTLYDNHIVRYRQKLDTLIQLALTVMEHDNFAEHNHPFDIKDYEELGDHYLDFEDPELVEQTTSEYILALKEYKKYVKKFPAKDWARYRDYRSISKFIRERDAL